VIELFDSHAHIDGRELDTDRYAVMQRGTEGGA